MQQMHFLRAAHCGLGLIVERTWPNVGYSHSRAPRMWVLTGCSRCQSGEGRGLHGREQVCRAQGVRAESSEGHVQGARDIVKGRLVKGPKPSVFSRTMLSWRSPSRAGS